MKKPFQLLISLILLTVASYASAFTVGTIPGVPLGDVGTQQTCTQHGTTTVPLSPNNNPNWRNAGLNRSVDDIYYKQDIIAYKIQWFSGAWSNWIVKGVNDLYDFTTVDLVNPSTDDARLTWIYFYDHNYLYIGCVG
jgi:hypothetical protein